MLLQLGWKKLLLVLLGYACAVVVNAARLGKLPSERL